MENNMTRIPDDMLDLVTGGLVKGWGRQLISYMAEYKRRGYSCGRFINLIKGTPDILGASSQKERKKVIDYIESHWDSI